MVDHVCEVICYNNFQYCSRSRQKNMAMVSSPILRETRAGATVNTWILQPCQGMFINHREPWCLDSLYGMNDHKPFIPSSRIWHLGHLPGGCGPTIWTLLQSPCAGSHGILDVVPGHLGWMLLATCTTLSGTLGPWRSHEKEFWVTPDLEQGSVTGYMENHGKPLVVKHGALFITSAIRCLGGSGGTLDIHLDHLTYWRGN